MRGWTHLARGRPSINVWQTELNQIYCVHLSIEDQEKSLSHLKYEEKNGHSYVLVSRTLFTSRIMDHFASGETVYFRSALTCNLKTLVRENR